MFPRVQLLSGATLALLQITAVRRTERAAGATTGNTSLRMFAEPKSREGALIVGGGPAGQAAALMLAKRGWSDIIVLEKTHSPSYFDPGVAFVYRIDRRGQFFLDGHGLTEKLAEVSVDTFSVTRIPVGDKRKEVPIPTIDDTSPTGYWVPRSVFQQLLYREVEAKHLDKIKVFFSATCDSIEQLPGGGGFEVRATLHGGGGEEGQTQKVFRPRLLVGADGLNSMVRQNLRSWDEEEQQKEQASSGKRTKPGKGRFDMRKHPSGSSGLRYKVLSLAPRFRLGNDDDARAQSEKAYVITSKFTDAKRKLKAGILPWGPPGGDRENKPRGATFITWPGHPLWDLKTGDEVKAYFGEAFPQIPIASEIGDEELSRFAQSEGGRFPEAQYCPGHHWLVKGEGGGDGGWGNYVGGGAVLLGDAIHAFPPDLGQGVNSALEDVLVLERALERCGDRLEDALPEYERTRAADSKALARLCQIGCPWEYGQPSVFGSKLWVANFLLRTFFLNKFFPKIFGPQAFMMIQTNCDKPYSKILAETNRTTRRIWGTAVTIALAIAFRRRLHMVVPLLANVFVFALTLQRRLRSLLS